MRNIKTYIIILFLLPVSSSESQWFQQYTDITGPLNGVFFINSNTGFVVGQSETPTITRIILKTTNGGINWVTNYPPSGEQLSKIQFINDNTGYAVGSWSILKTTNSGNNWNEIYSSTNYLEEIFFNDADIGYCVGFSNGSAQGVILKTTNGGSNWVLNYTTDSMCFFQKVLFLNYNVGFAVGEIQGDYAKILKTTNSGDNWFYIYGGEGTSGMYDICFTDPNNGFAAGRNGKIISTTNSGNTWSEQSYGVPFALYGITFATSTNGYIVSGGGQIFNTTNAGLNWTLQQQVSGNLSDIFFINGLTGFIVGNSGKIYKTTNGGNPIGIEPISNKLPDDYSLYQNYPNPFNPSTDIKFDNPKSGYVKLSVFDVLGKEIEILVNESLKTGTYKVVFDAGNYPSGVYYYRIETGNYSETKKMILIK